MPARLTITALSITPVSSMMLIISGSLLSIFMRITVPGFVKASRITFMSVTAAGITMMGSLPSPTGKAVRAEARLKAVTPGTETISA